VPSPVYSTRFALYEATATGEHDLYAVPSGMIAILRDIDVTLAGAGDFDVYIGGAGLALLHYLVTAPAVTNIAWRGRQVFSAGEVLYTVPSTLPSGGNVTIWMSGYLLEAA
jgi:hypothetical protein